MVGLPPSHIEVAALDDHGQSGFPEHRRDAQDQLRHRQPPAQQPSTQR